MITITIYGSIIQGSNLLAYKSNSRRNCPFKLSHCVSSCNSSCLNISYWVLDYACTCNWQWYSLTSTRSTQHQPNPLHRSNYFYFGTCLSQAWGWEHLRAAILRLVMGHLFILGSLRGTYESRKTTWFSCNHKIHFKEIIDLQPVNRYFKS